MLTCDAMSPFVKQRVKVKFPERQPTLGNSTGVFQLIAPRVSWSIGEKNNRWLRSLPLACELSAGWSSKHGCGIIGYLVDVDYLRLAAEAILNYSL